MICIIEALAETNREGHPLHSDSEVVYFGVTQTQAIRNAWNLFREYTAPIAQSVNIKDSLITLQNGVRIRLMGMDDPDAARGMKIRYAVLDEYADMPPHAWGEIIRPALADTSGGAFFIGTPKGKNHFYELHQGGETNPPLKLPDGDVVYPFEDFQSFNFTQSSNPTISEKERKALAVEYTNGSSDLYEQEINASFISRGGELFHADQFQVGDEPRDGSFIVTVDLAGFTKAQGKKEVKKLDDTAICVTKVDGHKWWVKDIVNGKWSVRETALRIVKAAVDCQATAIGIERGALANAVEPYIVDYMKQYNRFFTIVPLTHGNKHKYDRVQWALQGRMEKGQITFAKGDYLPKLIDQAVDFPSHLAHDDLVDALAYVDQMAETYYYTADDFGHEDQYVPLDPVSGF